MTQDEWFHHTSARRLTVGELQEALAELSRDTPVLLVCPDDAAGTTSTVINAVLVESRPPYAGHEAELLIVGSYDTGDYQRERRHHLTISGLATDDSAAGEAEIIELQEAIGQITKSRHRGASDMSRDEQTGTITWSWVHENSATAELVVRASEVAAALNPGTWSVRSEGPSQ